MLFYGWIYNVLQIQSLIKNVSDFSIEFFFFNIGWKTYEELCSFCKGIISLKFFFFFVICKRIFWLVLEYLKPDSIYLLVIKWLHLVDIICMKFKINTFDSIHKH